jgi:hypothetical protein
MRITRISRGPSEGRCMLAAEAQQQSVLTQQQQLTVYTTSGPGLVTVALVTDLTR